MKDWNEMSIEDHIEYLENKFQLDSSGTSKSVFELIKAYKELDKPKIIMVGHVGKNEMNRVAEIAAERGLIITSTLDDLPKMKQPRIEDLIKPFKKVKTHLPDEGSKFHK